MKYLKYFKSRIALAFLLLALQLVLYTSLCGYIRYCCSFLAWFEVLVGVVFSIHAMMSRGALPCRFLWIISIMAVPIVFIPLYILYGRGTKLKKIYEYEKNLPKSDMKSTGDKTADCVWKFCGLPAYSHTDVTYLSTGQEFFASLVEEIKRSKKFILIEFFIIAQGRMWNEIHSLLIEKANSGVEVYIIYDYMGSDTRLPTEIRHNCEKINYLPFNCFNGRLSPEINYRDHRKLISIDGKIGYCGGINIADEYINKQVVYGYWKDTACKLEGAAVNNLTEMFLRQWRLAGGKLNISIDKKKSFVANDKICLPFYSFPTADGGATQHCFLQMISCAEKTLYITTPYLIPDDNILTALYLAVESGVDVRIITPQIPDKKTVNKITRSNYKNLLEHGVRIFEYSGGFIHSKTILADRTKAYIGSANLDYRSLYLNYECGVYMANVKACSELAEDFVRMFASSPEIKLDKKIISLEKNWLNRLLRLFRGLM